MARPMALNCDFARVQEGQRRASDSREKELLATIGGERQRTAYIEAVSSVRDITAPGPAIKKVKKGSGDL